MRDLREAEPVTPRAASGASATAAQEPTAAADPGEVMRTCPVCGKPLAERKCKLFCPDPVCGYYLSCADFY